MVLSDDERRKLDDIERDLVQDQVFAGRFAQRSPRQWEVVGDVLGLIGLTVVLAGFLITQAGPASRVVLWVAGLSLIGAAVVIQLGNNQR